VELRPAEPADAAAVAVVHTRAWQLAYRGLIPDTFLDQLKPEDFSRRYTFGLDGPADPATILAVEGAQVLGFATVGPCRDGDRPAAGELWALYVDPAAWDTGAGRALIAAGRARLAELGLSDAVLWMLEGNRRAERFYRIDGWRPDGETQILRVHGVPVPEVRFYRGLP
jgi:GNAT superfamily N-acetyltransferase